MSDNLPAQQPERAVESRRTEIIERLQKAFAKDIIGLEEYESRVERAEKAATGGELEVLVSDLPKTVTELLHEDERAVAETETIKCSMGTKKIDGTALLARKISIEAPMSTIRLDYKSITPRKGIQELNVKLNMSTLILEVPDSVGVESRVNENMSTFVESGTRKDPSAEIETIVRITGESSMSTIKVKREKKRWFSGRK